MEPLVLDAPALTLANERNEVERVLVRGCRVDPSFDLGESGIERVGTDRVDANASGARDPQHDRRAAHRGVDARHEPGGVVLDRRPSFR